jgi:hypothetical protein
VVALFLQKRLKAFAYDGFIIQNQNPGRLVVFHGVFSRSPGLRVDMLGAENRFTGLSCRPWVRLKTLLQQVCRK